MSSHSSSPRRGRILRITFVVVIAALATTFSGMYVYSVRAIEGLEITCATVGSPYVGSPRPNESALYGVDVTVPITFGVENPSFLPMTTAWHLTFDYGNGTIISDKATFHIPAHGIAYPKFKLTVPYSVAQQILYKSNPQVYFTQSFHVSLYSFERKASIPLTIPTSGSGSQSTGHQQC